MFSLAQKQKIAHEVEQSIMNIGHPEMPTERPDFTVHIKGKESWSWAEIRPNWTFDERNRPSVNPHNEAQAQ